MRIQSFKTTVLIYLSTSIGGYSSSIAAMRSKLAQIGDSTAELTKMSVESELTIQEHCDSLRQQVDIARETAIESIHKASTTLMSEIDAYERDCLSRWSAAKESTEVTVKRTDESVRRRTTRISSKCQGK